MRRVKYEPHQPQGDIRVLVPQLMAEHGMNIRQLADIMEVSWPTAKKLASGNLPWLRTESLVRLCEIFDVEPGDILIYRKQKIAPSGQMNVI